MTASFPDPTGSRTELPAEGGADGTVEGVKGSPAPELPTAAAAVDSSSSPGPKRRALRDRWPSGLFWVLIGYLAYIGVWTYLSELRIYALRASVFDLGGFVESGWLVFSAPGPSYSFLLELVQSGGNLVFWPFALTGIQAMVAIQTASLGLGGVLVFFLARQFKLSPAASVSFSAIYYLYFPVAAVNFSDYHIEAFFIPLFLAGTYLFLRAKFLGSFLCLVLAGVIWFPLAVFPGLFATELIVARWFQRRRSREIPHPSPVREEAPTKVSAWERPLHHAQAPPPDWYSVGLFLASALLLGGNALTSGLSSSFGQALLVAHASNTGVGSGLGVQVLFLLLLLAPLAFLPLLSPRWLVYCLPYFFLELFASYPGYTYPGVLTDWHVFLLIPFVFLGAIDGLDRIRERSDWLSRMWRWFASTHARRTRSAVHSPPATLPPHIALRHRRSRVSLPVVVTSIALCSTLVVGLFLLPYGPYNDLPIDNYQTGALLSYNPSLYQELIALSDLIPRSSASVIFQNNMPELLPRPLLPGASQPMVPGPFGIVAYNLTYQSYNGSWMPIHPDYVIGNPAALPSSFFSAMGGTPFNTSVSQILGRLFGTGSYGTLGEASGIWLIQRGYHGPIRYYVPDAQSYQGTSFVFPNATTPCGGGCLTVRDLTRGQLAWYGPYTYLSPGTYRVDFEIAESGWNSSSGVTLEVTGESAKIVLAQLPVGPSLLPPGAPRTFSLEVNATNGLPNVEFRAFNSHFSGTLSLLSVQVQEIAPPA
jgi:uncharacterized membrane protein